MPENQTPSAWSTMSPGRKSAIATAIMTMFLVLFTFGGYWYGKNAETTTTEKTTNTNTATLTNTVTNPTNEVTLSGKLVSITGTALEMKVTGAENDATQQVSVDSATAYRKLDFRTIPKDGMGDGVAIPKANLKATNEIVVLTTKTGVSYKAEKVYLVLYP